MKSSFAKILIVCLCGLSLALKTSAQNTRRIDRNQHLWLSLMSNTKLTSRFWVMGEVHLRRADEGREWQQYLLRPIGVWQLTDNVMTGVGYTYTRNFAYDDDPKRFASHEHHLFEHVQVSQNLGRVRLLQRYRLEHRWMSHPEPNGTGAPLPRYVSYLNRFRYRLSVLVPLTKPRLQKNTLFLNMYDEAFVNFGKAQPAPFLHQNRISGLVGWQFDDRGSSIQLGYLNQFIDRPTVIERNHTLHVMFTYNLDFSKQD